MSLRFEFRSALSLDAKQKALIMKEVVKAFRARTEHLICEAGGTPDQIVIQLKPGYTVHMSPPTILLPEEDWKSPGTIQKSVCSALQCAEDPRFIERSMLSGEG